MPTAKDFLIDPNARRGATIISINNNITSNPKKSEVHPTNPRAGIILHIDLILPLQTPRKLSYVDALSPSKIAKSNHTSATIGPKFSLPPTHRSIPSYLVATTSPPPKKNLTLPKVIPFS